MAGGEEGGLPTFGEMGLPGGADGAGEGESGASVLMLL